MRERFRRALRIYKVLLILLSILFWVYMMVDDWDFIRSYGITLQSVLIWIRYFFAWVVVLFSVLFWITAGVGIGIYSWRRAS